MASGVALYWTCYANQDAAFRISLAPSRECIADVVMVLLDHGADVRITDTRGKTPLQFAETEEIIDMLVEAGSDVHARATNDDSTVLHHAAGMNNCEALLASPNTARNSQLEGRPRVDAVAPVCMVCPPR